MSSKTLITCCAVFAAFVAANAAQYKPLPIDADGKLAPNSKFVSANNIVTTPTLSVFVDMFKTTIYWGNGTIVGSYFTDCELKVLDKNGNIIYFFSTIKFRSRAVQGLHDQKYNDNNAVVYYYVSGAASSSVCVKPKKLFPQSKWNSSIGATEQISGTCNSYDGFTRITAIQIYPSEAFHSAFLNPENTVVVWRQSVTDVEKDGKGEKVWRPAIIQYQR